VKVSECNADFQIGLLKHDMPIWISALQSSHFQFEHKISLPDPTWIARKCQSSWKFSSFDLKNSVLSSYRFGPEK